MKGALPVIDVVIELGQTGSPLGENKDPLKEMSMEISPSLLTGNRYMIQYIKVLECNGRRNARQQQQIYLP